MKFIREQESRAIEIIYTLIPQFRSVKDLDDYLYKSISVRELFIAEIDNNRSEDHSEYLHYLTDLKKRFMGYFLSESLNDQSETNLIYYYINNSAEKYDHRSEMQSFESINTTFGGDDSKIGALNEDFEKQGYKFRKTGELPYTFYSPNYIKRIEEKLQENSLQELYLDFLDGKLSVDNPQYYYIRSLYADTLGYSVEEVKTFFIQKITGHILVRIKEVMADSRDMKSCFKDPSDFQNTIEVLRKYNIIDNNNHWRGIKLEKKGVLVDDTRHGVINALVIHLETKGYLQRLNMTTLVKAFDLTFQVSRSDKSRLKPLANNNEYMIYFAQLFPKTHSSLS